MSCARLAGLHQRLLAAGELQFLAGRLEIHRAVEQGQARGGIGFGDGEEKFRAANRAGGQRRLELDIGGLLAIEERRARRA